MHVIDQIPEPQGASRISTTRHSEEANPVCDESPRPEDDTHPGSDVDTLIDPEELKLPEISSLVIVVVCNLLLQVRTTKSLLHNS
jgi:hypothetical protein